MGNARSNSVRYRFVQVAAFTLAVGPGAFLILASFAGYGRTVGRGIDPGQAGVLCLAVTAGLAIGARLFVAITRILWSFANERPLKPESGPPFARTSANGGADSSRRSRSSLLALAGDPFASWPIVAISVGACFNLVLAFYLGNSAHGIKAGSLISDPAETRSIVESARIFWGPRPSLDADSIVISRASGFGVDVYEAVEDKNVTITLLFDDFGFPMRCLRSPILLDLPRPPLEVILDPSRDEFLWHQITNIRLLPLGFAVNTLAFAAVFAALWQMPGTIRSAIRVRRGLCPACGYPVGTSSRCSECGNPIARR